MNSTNSAVDLVSPACPVSLCQFEPIMSAMATENLGEMKPLRKEHDLQGLPLHFQLNSTGNVPAAAGSGNAHVAYTTADRSMATQAEPKSTPATSASGVPVANSCNSNSTLGNNSAGTSQERPATNKPHWCTECGATFTRIDHLHRHMKTKKGHTWPVTKLQGGSNGDRSEMFGFTCPDCGKEFARSDHMNRHRRSHIGSRRCRCARCGEWLPSRPARNQHMWERHGIQLFECGQCAWGFTKASYLTRHLREKHSDFMSDNHLKPVRRPYTCGICSVDFPRASQCSKHMELHHQSSAPSLVPTGPVFPTMMSSQQQNRYPNENIVQHMPEVKSEHRRHPCPDCGREFSGTDHLAVHMNKHSGCRPFCCGVCGMDFMRAQDLKAHMCKHTGSRPYTCSLCQATFANPNNLARHERQHTSEKPYKCSICESSFPHKGALVSHERTHLGTRPFTCELCGARFARTDALKRHRRTHKEVQQESRQMAPAPESSMRVGLISEDPVYLATHRFACDMCGARFARADTLKRHRRTHKELREENLQMPSTSGSRVFPGPPQEEKSYLSL